MQNQARPQQNFQGSYQGYRGGSGSNQPYGWRPHNNACSSPNNTSFLGHSNNYYEKGRAPDLKSVLADFMTYQASSKGDCYSMQQQGTQFQRDYSSADYQWESEWKPYYHNEAE